MRKNEKLNNATINLDFLVLEHQRLNNGLTPRGLLARHERDRLTVEKATIVTEEKEK
jgi:hypothetical protein